MINKPPRFKGLNIRILIIVPIQGRGVSYHGFTLGGAKFVNLSGRFLPFPTSSWSDGSTDNTNSSKSNSSSQNSNNHGKSHNSHNTSPAHLRYNLATFASRGRLHGGSSSQCF